MTTQTLPTEPVDRPSEPPLRKWVVPIRVLAGLATVAVLAAGTVSAVAFFMIRSTTETSHFPDRVSRVQVTGETGDVWVRTDSAAQGATVLSYGRSAFRTTTHSERVIDGVLQVTGSCRGGGAALLDQCSINFKITVPPGTAVTVRTTTGEIAVTGTSAPVTAQSNTGDIHVWKASGPIQLITDIGDINGELLSSGVASGRSNTGDVRLNFTAAPDQITANTDIGDIRIQVPDDATKYRVTADVNLGERQIKVPTDAASPRVADLSTATGDIRMGFTN
ncbi:MAG TPA: DUF4097 family beta strand repeat-containing protein [Kineosporiaceae bacterium]|nr:DUF4097 family beta strand repeat-containing protein [Kineosporiaceae bacterium]